MSEQTSNKLAVSNYDRIKAMAKNEDVIKSFAAVLGNRTTAQAYISSALLAVANNATLMECTPPSIMQCALRSATLRLSCDPALGQAYLVPYNDRNKGKVATLQLGYKGIKQMGLRTNKYRFINAGRLYDGQVIEQNQLTGATKILGQRRSDTVIGYFNYFEYFNGYSSFWFMTNEELWKHAERYSKSYQTAIKYGKKDSLWQTNFDDMAMKTVTRLNLLRNGTLTAEDAAVIEAMGEDAASLEGDVVDSTFEDVRIPDAEIVGEKAEKASKTADQLTGELGFEPAPSGNGHKATPAPVVIEDDETPDDYRPWMSTLITLEQAQAVMTMPKGDDTGTRYWDLDTGPLVVRVNSMKKYLKDHPELPNEKFKEYQHKIDAGEAILAYRQ